MEAANVDVPRLQEEIAEDERVLADLRSVKAQVNKTMGTLDRIKSKMAMTERKIAELQADVKSVEEIMREKDLKIEVSISYLE